MTFVSNFGRGGAFNILDSHPKQQAQQAKRSRVILTNSINIINSVQPHTEFLAGLAGQYTDKQGIKHMAEDLNQATRRFPLLLVIREDDFDIMFNKGFVDKDSHAYRQYVTYETVSGNMKKS